jgi:hypothetical protein
VSWSLFAAVTASPTVVVSLLSGRSIKGAMVESGKHGIVLRAAQVEDTDAAHNTTWTRMDGDVFVPIAQIEFYQTGLDASILGPSL